MFGYVNKSIYLCNIKHNNNDLNITIMRAFIDICPKSHKGGQIFFNDFNTLEECHAWFDLNLKDMEKVARRKNIEYVKFYVKNSYTYEVLDSYTIFNDKNSN